MITNSIEGSNEYCTSVCLSFPRALRDNNSSENTFELQSKLPRQRLGYVSVPCFAAFYIMQMTVQIIVCPDQLLLCFQQSSVSQSVNAEAAPDLMNS